MGTPTPPQPPNDKPEPKSLFGVLLGIVTSVQDWNRAGILIALGAATLVGVLVWQARDRLIDDILRDSATPAVGVNEEIAPAVAQRLLGLKGSVLVSVWVMDLERNRRKLVAYAAQTDNVKKALDDLQPLIEHGYPVLFDAPGANGLFVRALNGTVACEVPTGPAPPEVVTALAGAGITYVCALTVPPDASAAKGLLLVYFQAALDATQVASIRPMLWEAAVELGDLTPPTTEPHSRGQHGHLAATAAADEPPTDEQGEP